MNVPERLREVAKHLRVSCKSCQDAQGVEHLAELARKVSAADMEDNAMELDRIALRLETAKIIEVSDGE